MNTKILEHLQNLIPSRNEAGQSIVIVALVFMGLLAMAGLAIDVGVLWYNKSQLDAHADAAALAGGEELTRAASAREKAEQYLYLNDVISGTDGIQVEINFGQNKIDNDVMVVDLYKDQELALLPLLGFKTGRLHSHAAVYATTWATEDAWSLFRGGCGRTGYRSETGSYTESTAGNFKVEYYWGFRWDLKGDTENHRSTPVIAMHSGVMNNNPIAYVGTNGPNKDDGINGGVLAFSGVTSDTLWYTDLGTMIRSSPYFLNDSAVIANFSTPHTNIPAVIVAGHNGHEYALNALTGGVIWDTPGLSADAEESGNQKYRSSPAYSCGPLTIGSYTGGVIFNATFGGNIYAYNAETGAILWRSTPDPTAALASWVTTTNDQLALDRVRNTGPMYATVNYVNDQEFIDAGYSQGVIFVASFGLDGKGGGAKTSPYLYAIDAATGQGIWFDALDSTSSPAYPSDRNSNAIAKIDTDRDGTPDQWRIFANPTDNYLYAYNAVNGTRLWRMDTGAKNHRSDPAIYKNIVFGGNNDGFYALDAVDGFSIWDDVDSDGSGPDTPNPYFSLETNPGPSAGFNAAGVRLIPGGVKSAPAIVDGIVMVGANQTSTGGSGGSMWALWWADGHVLSARQPTGTASDEEVEFCTYNLDLLYNETFNIRNYVQYKDGQPVDWSKVFLTYTEAGANNPTNPVDWHLSDFNAGVPVTVVATDANSGTGNQGDGEYRIYVYRQGEAQFDDHMTIRVNSSGNSDLEDAKCAWVESGNYPQPPDFNADDNDPPFDTDTYDGPGPYFGGSNDGDVRSGVVVGPDGNVYFGATDGVLYQLHVSRRLILIE